MSDPFVAEIRMFAGNFAPQGWAFCAGQTMAISQNTTLFSLIGTTYGGDGVNTFNLPDLRSRIPLHQGNGFTLGQVAGEEEVTLTTGQLPAHTHPAVADAGEGELTSPSGGLWAASSASPYAGSGAVDNLMAINAVGLGGSSQPHENRVPFLAINFIISLFGVYPSRN